MSDLTKERHCEAVLFIQCGVIIGPATIREREGLILNNTVPYSRALLVQQFILR